MARNQTEEAPEEYGHANENLLASSLKSVINVYRRLKSSLEREINFEVHIEMSNHHPKREIPTQNVVNNEPRNVNSNVFQKAIGEVRSTSPDVTIFSEFGRSWKKKLELWEYNTSLLRSLPRRDYHRCEGNKKQCKKTHYQDIQSLRNQNHICLPRMKDEECE